MIPWFPSSSYGFFLRFLSLPVSVIIKAIPKPYRFRVARALARAGSGVYRSTVYRFRRPPLLDGPREDIFRVMLRIMVRAGVDFDPVLVVKGAELVPPAAALFVTGHFRLNALWTRWLVDSGHKIAVVSGDPDLRVMGTSIPADILSGPNVLVATRSRLLSGGKVNCSIDSMIATPEWPRIETPAGPRWVSDVMPRLAERLRVPVLFMATRVDPDWNIVVTIEKPSTHDQATATREFCSFLLSQIAQIER